MENFSNIIKSGQLVLVDFLPHGVAHAKLCTLFWNNSRRTWVMRFA